ncbi:MAG TPA: CRTAC1 family protein [Pirellulales bacterium]|nr:CRTAC1 family protein [Pirellulales bacterium]
MSEPVQPDRSPTSRGGSRRLWPALIALTLAILVAGGLWVAVRNSRASGLAEPMADTALDTKPAPVDPAGIAFVDVARELGLTYELPQQPRPMRSPEAFGSGCALFDFDGDHWVDVLLVADPNPILYRNLSGKGFEDVTATMGLTLASADNWTGCTVGDYDGDGWLDLLLTGFHRLVLLRNADGKQFEEATGQVELDPLNHSHWGASAGFMDLDNDGDLDLVILNYVVFGPESKQYCELTPGVLSGCPPKEYEPEFGEVWRNNGSAGFELISAEQSGMDKTHGVGLVLAFTDYDDDNLMDFYIGNDGTAAEMMHNLGDMKFENVGTLSGLSVGRNYKPMAAMGVDWGDYNRDGQLDLTVTDFQKNCFALYRNEGRGFFVEASNMTGLSLSTCDRLGFGAKWIDMDNDRWPDICFANGHVYDNVSDIEGHGAQFRQPILLFRNLEGARFVDVVPVLDQSVARPLVGRGSAVGDFNKDGRSDLLVVDFEGPAMLLENRSTTPYHWLTLELRTPGPNKFAYGARVTGHAGGEIWVGQVAPASSYLSSSDLEVHWGLGKFDHLEKLTIRWPSGDEQTIENVAADQFLPITQGQQNEVAARGDATPNAAP